MKRIFFTALFLLSAIFIAISQIGKPAGKSQTKPAAVSPAAFKASMIKGKTIYNQYCLACHQADGSGVPNMNPPLSKTSWVTGPKPALIQVVLKGMDQNLPIDGEEYTNVMPSHSFLTDQQIADVLTYVRNDFGNKVAPVTAAEVKAQRGK